MLYYKQYISTENELITSECLYSPILWILAYVEYIYLKK